MIPVIVGHTPAGSSVDQVVHYGQLIRSGKFRQYDYGAVDNLFAYGRLTPPDYKIEAITAPVALHYSLNDWLAEPVDVLKLIGRLPNVIESYVIPDKKFNHLDFLFAIDVKSLVYDKVISLMKRYE